MDQKNLPPHVLVFPLPFQGPTNSTFKLAELLCVSGLHITTLVTEHIHARLLESTNNFSHLDCFPGFQLKIIPDGLPLDHPRSGTKFMEVIDSLKAKIKPLFKEMLTSGFLCSETRRPITCIVADGILEFTCDVAREIGIPIFYVRTISPCSLWLFFCFPKLIEFGEIPFKGNDLDVLIKSVPGTENFLRRRDLPSFCRLGSLADESLQVFSMESQENPRADGLIINTFEELEEPIISHLRSICPNIYPIGPFHAHLKTKLSKETTLLMTTSSSSLWKEDRNCITWLDAQPLKSVIYVSFGSITLLTKDQLIELWYGLVNSGIKFLWVMRPDIIAEKDWETWIPAELLEGTKQRGYIVDWTRQQEVLEHGAVGGFFTHSGWNSTLESIYAGVPMICWPYFADQQVNSRFVSEVWKVGLDMKDTCDRTIVEKMVRDLMVEKKDQFSQTADAMAKLARRSLSHGGSSSCNLDRLIRDINNSITALPHE